MNTFFLICAVLGGTLMICQFLASLFGLGGDYDTDGGDAGPDLDSDADYADSSWFFGVLSFRALSAALTFFGLAGLAAHFGGLEAGPSLLVALGSGLAALYLVASMMRMLARLKSDGTVRIERSVGQTGTVYLRVPANRAGAGKVTLVLQGRTIECLAITADKELPTGSPVKVVAVLGPGTVEVVPVTVEDPAHV